MSSATQRYFLLIVTAVALFTVALMAAHEQLPAIWSLLFITIGLVIYISWLHVKVNRFSLSVQGKKLNGLDQLFESVKRKLTQNEETTYRIITAIDKIGNGEQDLTTGIIQGEAGDAIVNLHKKIKSLKEEEKQRLWAAQGIASISEIRKNNSDLKDYSFQMINYLVQYLDANQGAFYIMEDNGEDSRLELLSTYAYGRRKHTNEQVFVPVGHGLTGQVVLERQLIMLTDVPKDYIKITSGLGEATPTCVVIVPLVFRDHVFGVIEVASFARFEEFSIKFIQKAGESIALELSGIREQERTKKMLTQSREEELRQNIEEMRAIQKEMQHKEIELSAQLANTKRAMAMAESEQKKNEAILEGCMDAVISFNQNGAIEYFNKAAEEVFGFDRNEVIGKPIQRLLDIRITGQGDYIRIVGNNGNEVSIRTEMNAADSRGEEVSLLLTATQVQMDNKHLFTLFAQKVSVDLF